MALIYGRKSWFIYPNMPAHVQKKIGVSNIDWKHASWYETDGRPEDQPILCQQRSNSIMYLPERFHHATENQGEAIAVGWQGAYAETCKSGIETIFPKNKKK